MNLLLYAMSLIIFLFWNNFETVKCQSGEGSGSGTGTEPSTPEPSTPEPPTPEPSTPEPLSPGGLSSGAIAGIVIGSIAGCLLLAGGAYYFYRQSSVKSVTMTDLEVNFRHQPLENRLSVVENGNDNLATDDGANEEDKTTEF